MAALPSSHPTPRRAHPPLRLLAGGRSAPQARASFDPPRFRELPDWEWPVPGADDPYRRSPARLAAHAADAPRAEHAVRPQGASFLLEEPWSERPMRRSAPQPDTLWAAPASPTCPRRGASPATAPRWLRQALGTLVSLGLVAGVWIGAGALRGGAASPGTIAGASAAKGGGYEYVVRPGDTLWSIATRLEPNADPRPLVDRLAAEVPSGVLSVGERLHLP